MRGRVVVVSQAAAIGAAVPAGAAATGDGDDVARGGRGQFVQRVVRPRRQRS